MNIYAGAGKELLVLVAIIAVAGTIALVSFLLYRYLHPKMKQTEVVDEKEAVKEELERILEPVEDDKIADEIANYVDDEDQ